MEYAGRYPIFDSRRISTYPVSQRQNKVQLADLSRPDAVMAAHYDVCEQAENIAALAEAMVAARRAGRAVMWLTGAHLVKNGMGPLVADLVRRGLLTLAATNGAGVIHDFELALFGATSEYVPNALPEGKFGMAYELSYINAALAEADERKLGYGEGVGRMICDAEFRQAAAKRLGLNSPIRFQHPEVSILDACYETGTPLTVHVGIGTDVIDQHANFDGRAKGGCSGRDFLIFTQQTPDLGEGGVFLNVGCAVTGPEVLLKAVSVVGSTGQPPYGLITADLDLKDYRHEAMTDESSANYYYRHHKSVVTRIPEAFSGRGFYIRGDQRRTVPRLYQEIIRRA